MIIWCTKHKMTSRKSTIFMFFGIVIGLCFGILFKNYRALEIIKKCSFRPSTNKDPLEIIDLRSSDTVTTSQTNLVFVGVMTAQEFLSDRAKAVYDTWGKDVPGRLAFFSSEGSISSTIPVIALKGVDDRYPPQKKSFRMLYYMYEHYIDRFEWFARADDDVYINTQKLEKFLRSIDSLKPQFIGQAGRGNSEEFGLLSLEFDENFCMGGPGIIMSRETLRRVAPHIPTCLKNLYSTHEDVEVGRCVQKFAGIPCTWNYEMQSILHHNSSGPNAFTGSLKTKEVHNAITLHPVKHPPLMYRLHTYMQGLRAQDIRQEALHLHRDIAVMKTILMSKSNELDFAAKFENAEMPIFPSNEPDDANFIGDHDILSAKPHLNKYKISDRSELATWNFIARSLYSTEQTNPKRKIDSANRESLNDVIGEVMDYINYFSRQRGRIIDFKEVLYGYTRFNPLYGQDMILDMLLIYKKYRGKKMTVPVRRHLYLQRAFTDYHIREMVAEPSEAMPTETTRIGNLTSFISMKVKDIWQSGVNRISDTAVQTSNGTSRMGFFTRRPLTRRSDQTDSTVVFVLPLAGRFQTFLRFLKNYEQICLQHPDTLTELLIVLFTNSNDRNLQSFIDEIDRLQTKYTKATLNLITIDGSFSRGIALNRAIHSTHIQMDDIIFFIDVDITFKRSSIDRIRMNTIRHRQVYFPIVFGQYNRNVWQTPEALVDADDFSKERDTNLHSETGYFRQFGYGICAIYKADILHPSINGFDEITGWGLEDVRFLEKIVKLQQTPLLAMLKTQNANTTDIPITLNIFRAPDPTLVHVYHDISCDATLSESQYSMCLGTKASTLGSFRYVERIFLGNQTIVDFTRKIS